MEFHSHATSPSTVTLRRNPRRKTRETSSSIAPPLPSYTPQLTSAIKSLSLEETLEAESLPHPLAAQPPETSDSDDGSKSLRVFLRIRPLDLKPVPKKKISGKSKSRAVSEKEKMGRTRKKMSLDNQAVCLFANDSQSVTLTLPPLQNESKRKKSENFDGFSYVFTAESSQREIYDLVMKPLVSDFIKGKSRLLAAMGPTGSGKTHTMFGCPRDPGLVPLALREIFNQNSDIGGHAEVPRSLFFSMFEICSERGKGERISDLSTDIADINFQQSIIKGVKEAIVTNISQAECFISCGLMKRATAATNENNHSSRSQCIINIRRTYAVHDEVGAVQHSVLTIVDLAGAEREKRTGIQGTRLMESNFINNTSMIFGLCLRSLLEHQKNPKKPLQKHFLNSLLTKFLRDYLEGKKRMTLILTAKPGVDDYADTSFLLRHASPYMKIKYVETEELPVVLDKKRQIPPSHMMNQPKRRKCNGFDALPGSFGIDGEECGMVVSQVCGKSEDITTEQLQELVVQKDLVLPLPPVTELQKVEREYRILQDLSKAMWNILKQYKEKSEVAETQVKNLEESLHNEKVRSSDLKKELDELKSTCTCHVQSSLMSSDGAKMSLNSEAILTDSPGVGVCLIENDCKRKDGGQSCNIVVGHNAKISDPLSDSQELANRIGDSSNVSHELDAQNKENRPTSSEDFKMGKPRRKLLPASTMLVKEVGSLDLEDDNPKNTRKAGKMEAGARQTNGSMTLLQLLRKNGNQSSAIRNDPDM